MESPKDIAPRPSSEVPEGFHPAVAGWFRGRYGTPTSPQLEGWPAIRAGRHTLIAAPTGTGKTLAAFLAAIDDLVRQSLRGELATETQVVYVSPLKALSADIEKNLQEPLSGIDAVLREQGLPASGIRVQLRTGDTPAAERARMIKRPPHILVTTPESLFILLTSQRGREMLSTVRSIIVDEIHAMVGDKRGSHLALSMERLEALAAESTRQGDLTRQPGEGRILKRIGLSATQKPIAEVARFLVGSEAVARDGTPECTIVDTGHIRERDLSVEMPESPLEAVMSGEVWGEVYHRLAELVESHRTTLIFVNTRRMAERVAHHLSERLGEDKVAAHHGSMAKEHRLDAEQRLKAGDLRAMVATASLELGLDVGAIDLVCQLGSTRSIAAFLQRAGRSGHSMDTTPKARLFPLTRDELVECAALLDAVKRGELDRIIMPDKPLDILAQQIVAAAACGEWGGGELFALCRRAWPYRGLERGEFDQVVDMLAKGYRSNRGRHGAYLYHDAVNDRLRGRKGARHAAIVSGGAIPDIASFEVVQEPANLRIGSLDEDFATESLPGDIFQLGNTSWRILRIEPGTVRVEDAQGQPPNIPFWLGESPGRTDELSAAVSRIREAVASRLGPLSPPAQAHPVGKPSALVHLFGKESPTQAPGDAPPAEEAPAPLARTVREDDPAVAYLIEELGLCPAGALQLVDYLAAGYAALGVMPSRRTLVAERFFDDSGSMQLVLHSPLGSRLNRAWGLALRKRFCRSFNFELQAAAIEDAIVLSLGPTHSFPLDSVFKYLHSASVRDVLVQALLDAPMFNVRWRHNANRSLAVLRRYGDRKVPPQLQRMRADDLLALVFPDQQACLENIAGDREVPDHPLVNQTVRDCLEEVMDIDGLVTLLKEMEAGEIELVARDLREPSPLAQEILNARPYAFLDDAPLEERRTRAVQSRRWLDPETAAELATLDPLAIAQVKAEAWPTAGQPDELHEALLLLGLLTEEEGRAGNLPGEGMEASTPAGWASLLPSLEDSDRATVMEVKADGDEAVGDHAAGDNVVGDNGERPLRRYWVAAEWLPALKALYPHMALLSPLAPPESLAGKEWTPASAAVELLRARLEACGPVRATELADVLSLPLPAVDAALLALESEGFVFRGRFSPGCAEEEWCERGLLSRIHRYTLNTLRREIEPVSIADFMRFLFTWHRVAPGEKMDGVDGLAALLDLLEGFEAPASAWEPELLAARMESYDKGWLDRLCGTGRVVWARLSAPPGLPAGNSATSPESGRRAGRRVGPVASTPIALLNRRNMTWWRQLADEGRAPTLEGLSAQARAAVQVLEDNGASFFDEIADEAGLLPTHTEAALGELVASGWISADSFAGLRALLTPARKRPGVRMHKGRASLAPFSPEGAGRWALLQRSRSVPKAMPVEAKAARPSALSGGLEGATLEAYAWVLLRRYGVVFRRMLEREHRAPPWRNLLRVYRRLEARGEIRGGRFVAGMAGEQYALPEAVVQIRAVRRSDPTGALISISAADPLNLVGVLTPGRRVPALTTNRVLFRDGVPVAFREGGRSTYLSEPEASEKWVLLNALEGLRPLRELHAKGGARTQGNKEREGKPRLSVEWPGGPEQVEAKTSDEAGD